MWTNDILILADQNFTSTEKKRLKLATIMTKDIKYFICVYFLKFNGAQIKLDLYNIVLIKKSYVGENLPVTNYIAYFTYCSGVPKKKLSFTKEYLAQMARYGYIIFVYQLKAYFVFFWVIQIVKLLPNNIAKLNKRLQ